MRSNENKNQLKMGARLGDITLIFMVLSVVLMMIVPLTQWLMDLLIGLNLGVSLLVFCTALFIKQPLSFRAFPTMLLVATLFRLALNISSTRLILTEADAGRIISAFGGFVMGDDIVIGAVIFGILAMVLFLVITKGAERVAEVAARFTLDALPGMQIAVETDLRSGAISPREFTKRRQDLENKGHYYGSLDGAMKFVRGDAVAALVIIAVNIAGGIAIGMLRHGMSASTAIDTYGRLTIGDGLVTMIPALFISTAAGLLVTRVGQGEGNIRLGEQMSKELLSEPRAVVAASVLMLMLAIIPGLPAWPFLIIGGALAAGGITGFIVERRLRMRQADKNRMDDASLKAGEVGVDNAQALLDKIAETHPVLIRETVPRKISLPMFADLLKMLIEDGLGELQVPALLEALARETCGDDLTDLMDRARRRMSREITAKLVGEDRTLNVAILSPELEGVIDGSLSTTSRGRRLALPAKIGTEILEMCTKKLTDKKIKVLLVSPSIRAALGRFLKPQLPNTIFLAHGEIEPDVTINISIKI